jgi:DNA polymerase-3 subunit delta'
LFLLVSHSPERLLPTIRSRCRHLRLGLLEGPAMSRALAAALPDADEAERAELAEAGEGSPGRAIAYRGLDIGALERTMQELAAKGDPGNGRRVELAQALSGKAAQGRYEAFLARAPSVIAAHARDRRGPALAQALGLWERASELAAGATRLSLEPQSVVFELGGMLAALAPEQR